MRSLSNDFTKYLMYFVLSFFAVGLTSCSNDDDVDDVTPDNNFTGTITASDQTLSGNTLIIEDVTVGQDSWVIVRNADDQTMAADPYLIRDNEDGEVRIELNDSANLTGNVDGDDFIVSLYSDNPNQGTMGTYDEGVDQPIRDANNADVTQTVNTTAPSLMADDDQMVSETGDVTFTNVNTGSTGGWIALYGENEDGTINEDEMIGVSEYIAAGPNENVTARFNEGYQYQEGQNIYPRLFVDDPNDMEFTYTSSEGTEDLPETYGYDPTTQQANPVWNSSETGSFTLGNSAPAGGNTGTDTDTDSDD